MKRGNKDAGKAQTRPSVSLSSKVAEWAYEMAEKKGFERNFSAYVADLVRRDKERDDAMEALKCKQEPTGEGAPRVLKQSRLTEIEEAARVGMRRPTAKKEEPPKLKPHVIN